MTDKIKVVDELIEEEVLLSQADLTAEEEHLMKEEEQDGEE